MRGREVSPRRARRTPRKKPLPRRRRSHTPWRSWRLGGEKSNRQDAKGNLRLRREAPGSVSSVPSVVNLAFRSAAADRAKSSSCRGSRLADIRSRALSAPVGRNAVAEASDVVIIGGG